LAVATVAAKRRAVSRSVSGTAATWSGCSPAV
jgi:hypothetical protein